MIVIFFSDSLLYFSANIYKKNIRNRLNCYLEYVTYVYLMLKFCHFPMLLIKVTECKISEYVSEDLENAPFKNLTRAKIIRKLVNV
jgi:hypothetical protein